MTREDLLREVLRSEAAQVVPAGDGLTKIRAGVVRREARRPWVRVGYLGGATATVAAAVVAFLLVGTHGNPDHLKATQPPAGSGSVSLTAADRAALRTALWPFHTPAEVAAWRFGIGEDYLGDGGITLGVFRQRAFPGFEVTVGSGSGEGSPLQRRIAGRTSTLGQVRLHGFGIPSGGALGGPWVVQSITNPYLTIDSPGVGAGVPRRFTVRGSYPPGDPGVRVRLLMGLDLHDVATARATYSPQGFAATLDAGSARGYAVVLVTNDSGVDGGPSAVSAIPVQLTDTPALPSSYVAVVNDRVAVIDSASGHVVRYLTDLQPGGGVSDAQLSPSGDVVYAQGAGTCASAIMSVPLRGGTPTVLVDAKGTSTLAQPALADDGSLAYLRTRCQGGATELVVRRPGGQLLTAATGVKLAGPLSWDPADSLFWVDSSDRTHLRSWSAHGDPSPHDPDAGPGCRWTALTVRGAKNDVLAARQCGAHVTFVAFDSDLAAPTPVFSFDGQPPIWLDADATGQQLIYVRYTGTEKTTVFARAEGQSPVRLATGQMYPTW